MSIFFDENQPDTQPGCVYIRSPSNPREYLYIEMQAEIKSTLEQHKSSSDLENVIASSNKQYLWGQTLGEYTENHETNKCTLKIGNLIMTGQREKLKKPYLILLKRPSSVPSTTNATTDTTNTTISTTINQNTSQTTTTMTTLENNDMSDKSSLLQTTLTSSLASSLVDDSNEIKHHDSITPSLLDSCIRLNNDKDEDNDMHLGQDSLTFFDNTILPLNTINNDNMSVIPSSLLNNDLNLQYMNKIPTLVSSADKEIIKNDEQTISNDGASLLQIPAIQHLDCVGVVQYVAKFTSRPAPIISSIPK